MTNLYSRVRYYRLSNKGRAKYYIDIIELVLAAFSFPAAVFLTKTFMIKDLDVKNTQGILFTIMVVISWFVLSRVTSVAKIPRTQRNRTLVFQMSQVAFITFVGLIAFKFIFGFKSIHIVLIGNYVTIMYFANLVFRILIFKILKSYRVHGGSQHYVLLMADSFSDSVIEKLIRTKEWGFKINGIITESKMIKAKYGDNIPIYSEKINLKSLLDTQIIDEVLHCKKKIDKVRCAKVAELCNETGVIFRLQSSVSPIDPVDFQLQTMIEKDDLNLIDAPANNLGLILKNMGDMYFSLLSLLVFSPLFLLLGLIIKIDSRGPVFFKQERIGLRGRKFKLYKFRTMVINAEELLAKLQVDNEADGPVFKIKHDPRITKIGRILRKTGMDELPQLLNVIKGEMSLIGPRPPLEKEVIEYKRWQLKRLSVKPGITCTWQVVPERHSVSFEQWMELDMSYIKNWSIFKDLGLFFKTFKALLLGGGH